MEKIKDFLKEKGKKKENLVVFLIILVITLIIINSIIKEDDEEIKKDYSDAEFAVSNYESSGEDLEKKLENVLNKMSGVSDVSVLITYSSSNESVPIYNEKASVSVTEEVDKEGGTRTIESNDTEKTVVSGSDSNPVVKQTNYPKIEGAIIMAKGAGNSNVKANIISAVEAVTGLATHKIQVFESN